LAASITAAILYFVPLYIAGLAENWEILVFVVGIILIALEVFVIPGFGIAGVLGITLVFAGLVLSLIGNVQFDFAPVDTESGVNSLLVVLGAIFGSTLILFALGKRLNTARIFKPLILATEEGAEAGYDVDAFRGNDLLHKEGVAITVLRPSGKIEVDGERYDAYSEAEYIDKGDRVIVLRAKGTALVVQKITPS